MADNSFVMPKGRRTIRKANPLGKPDATNARIGLWAFDAKPGTLLAKLERAYLTPLETVDSVAARKSDAAKSGKFTDQGVADDVRQFVLSNAAPELKRARLAVEAVRKEVAEQRAKIKLQAPDKGDVAGALMRREIRDRLAAMAPDERDKFIGRNIDNLDPAIAEAILTAPGFLSGVAETHRQHLTDKALEAQHGEAVTELQQIEKAIEIAAQAIELGRDAVRVDSGILDPHEFNRLAEPYEKQAAAPWLKKTIEGGEEVINVIVPGGSVTRASPEQIETGIFFANIDEYRQANGGASEAA